MRSLVGNLGCRFFSLITLNMSCSSFQACRVSAERSAVNLMGIPLCVICCFSLAAVNIFSLYLIFDSLINMCLGMFFLGFIMYGTLHFLELIDYFLSHVRDVFNYNLFKYFLSPLLLLFFFWDPYNSNVGVSDVVPEVSENVLHSFHSFFFVLLCGSYFHSFIFQVTYPFFCFSYSAIDSF